jgi:hypothetical protein
MPLRRGLLLLGVLALGLFAFSGSAGATVAPHTHGVVVYKVENHVDLPSTVDSSGHYLGPQAVHVHGYCNPGDNAVDGMWRIDHVDQANPSLGTTGDERNVQVDASYPDTVDPTKYHFRFSTGPTHLGAAQIKYWVVCLGGKTAPDTHQHDVKVSLPLVDSSHTGGGALGSGNKEFDFAGGACGADQLVVAPGFNYTSGSGRVYRSYPTLSFRNWHWAFVVNGPANLTLYEKCLDRDVAEALGHKHHLNWAWLPNYGGSLRHVPLGNQEQQLSCGDFGAGVYDNYKAIVGGFWINDPNHVKFIGMDPRIKTRAYRFWYDGSGSNELHLADLCLSDTTSTNF